MNAVVHTEADTHTHTHSLSHTHTHAHTHTYTLAQQKQQPGPKVCVISCHRSAWKHVNLWVQFSGFFVLCFCVTFRPNRCDRSFQCEVSLFFFTCSSSMVIHRQHEVPHSFRNFLFYSLFSSWFKSSACEIENWKKKRRTWTKRYQISTE